MTLCEDFDSVLFFSSADGRLIAVKGMGPESLKVECWKKAVPVNPGHSLKDVAKRPVPENRIQYRSEPSQDGFHLINLSKYRFDPGRFPALHHPGLGPDHYAREIIFEWTGDLAEFAIVAEI